MNSDPIVPASIKWTDNGYPVNTLFQDKYFSEDGIEESTAIFLEGNQLRRQWQTWQESHFTILETGFGTGLNFLLSLQLWIKSLDEGNLNNTRCQYFAIENSPISAKDIRRVHTLWPQLKRLSEQLCLQLPQPIPGRHLLKFYYHQHCFYLYLLYSDIETALEDLILENCVRVNSFFLDGFSPLKNPQIWNQKTCHQLAKIASSNSTLSTFTASSSVRRALINSGFNVSKKKGYEKKREMITAKFQNNKIQRPTDLSESRNIYNKRFLVIGAGLAGSATAAKLAQQGALVDIVDSSSSLCNGASGNAAGLAYPRLANGYDASCMIHLSGSNFLQRELINLKSVKANFSGIDFNFGKKNPNSRINSSTLKKLGLDEKYVRYHNSETESMEFLTCGWINPTSLAEAYLQPLIDEKKVRILFNSTINNITQKNSYWVASGVETLSTQKYHGVVICCGNQIKKLLEQYEFCTNQVRGQIDCFEVNKPRKNLTRPVCSSGYIIPFSNNQYWVGASYQTNNRSLEISKTDTANHLIQLSQKLDTKIESISLHSSRVGLRLTSKDRLPLIGNIADTKEYTEWFQQQLKTKKTFKTHKHYTCPPLQSGLYLNVAHGSHGLTTIPILTEHLVAQITGEASPICHQLHQSIDPQRFLQRKIKRGQ